MCGAARLGTARLGSAGQGLARQGINNIKQGRATMQNESKIIEYPLWTVAVKKILDRFDADGYGCKFSHTELKSWMGIEPPKTIDDARKADLDYLVGTDKARNHLLENYNIMLHRLTSYGHQILHPEDQIRKGADYYIQKSQKALTKFVNVLANVDAEQLSIDDRQIQLEKMNRAAFIKAAFRRRKIAFENKKQIE
jgi:hypothetical protein